LNLLPFPHTYALAKISADWNGRGTVDQSDIREMTDTEVAAVSGAGIGSFLTKLLGDIDDMLTTGKLAPGPDPNGRLPNSGMSSASV